MVRAESCPRRCPLGSPPPSEEVEGGAQYGDRKKVLSGALRPAQARGGVAVKWSEAGANERAGERVSASRTPGRK